MTEIYINTTDRTPAFQKAYTLTDTAYIVALVYNGRDDSYYMTLKDASGGMLIPSIRLVTGIFLLRNKRGLTGCPAGDFMVTQVSGQNGGVSYDNLGVEYKLNYYEPAEVTY